MGYGTRYLTEAVRRKDGLIKERDGGVKGQTEALLCRRSEDN